MGLRGKILGGALVLLVPLGLSLAFLNQYGSAQIEAARLEKAGIAVTAPLVNGALGWYADGRADLSAYVQALGSWSGPLNYTPEAMKAAGYPARAPEDLVRLAGGEGEFVPVMDELLGAVRYVADTSGLVLDPDLDSFYLMLALYQSLPNLVDDLTRLRTFTRPDLVLDLPGRLALHGSAVGLRTNTADLAKQIHRSVAALAQAYVPVPGYAQAMDEAVPALTSAVDALQADVAAAALEGRLDPAGLDRSLAALVPLLRSFQDAGSAALVVMLDGRIATFSARLTTAFAAALGGLVAAGVVLLWVAGSIRRRSTVLVGALGRVAEGDLAQGLEPGLLVSGDEVGRLARSTERLRDDMRAQVLNIEEVSAQLNTLGASLAASTEQSASAIEQMSATSAQVARFAAGQWDQTASATQATSRMADHIAESNTMTQGMAAHFFVFGQSMEANRRSIAATAVQAQTTGHLAERLSHTGQEGEKSLQSLRQSVGTVVERSKEIHTMVGFILDIAARTNLLAMNAAIEAAHAGSAGRGFAVVAEEIRKLAETSSRQAQGIEAQVAGIAEAADLTLHRSEATGQSFVSLSQNIEAVRRAAQAIAEQMAAQEEADARLSEGLVEFTGFYSRLSEAMEAQVAQSHSVLTALESLGDTSRQISGSMDEQKLGMEQAAAAVVEVRDNANVLTRIVAELAERMARFQT